MSVVIETTIGDITVDLYLKERPNTCLNFLKLCKIKYYNLCLFHKIEQNFIAQTGDPTGTGRGGESLFSHLYGDQAKYFDSEFKPRLKHEKLGTLSMVNNGSNMNGSQFFLTLGENLTYLDEVHTVFGEVVEGFEVLLKLNEAICDNNNQPYQDIRITHTVILHDPYDDPAGLEIPDASPEPSKEQLESNYIAADEEIDDTKGKDPKEIEEKIKESEAKARATILEMVGDIPDADVKPPENVLFVCKLNPVTTSEDLEIIFSRFGPIVSCEVIKDKKTGESLQYAFIEFEKEENCENAYFKMDNVLIDDRRIHVDFSQSVSKMNWDKNDTLLKAGQKFKSQNIVLKNNSRVSDGYDLIFDDNDYNTEVKSNKKSHHRSETPKYKHHSSRNEYSKSKNRHSSRSPNAKEDKHYKDRKERSPYNNHSYANSDKYYSEKTANYKYRGNDSSHSRDKRRDFSKTRYSPEILSKKYKEEGKSRKYSEKTWKEQSKNRSRHSSDSPEISPKKYRDEKASKKYKNKNRYDSDSPDLKKRQFYDKQRSPSFDYSNRTRYESDNELSDNGKKYKKHKSSYKDAKRTDILPSEDRKRKFEKSSHTKKHKKSRKRSRSHSSSNSD